ncbi:MAG: DUF2147 domain-containing protein [Treponema sp.]|nr:DUF2147 domain-containing protein [Treponema sp.]
MKKIILTIALLLGAACAFAQNDKADNIIGKYEAEEGLDAYRVNITKSADDTYKAQIYWVADRLDKDGNVNTDTKNPDKSLRSTPIDRVVLFKGLKYNPEKQNWSGTKIYDPNRGIKVAVTVAFDNPKVLKVKGTVLGIGETAVWRRIE